MGKKAEKKLKEAEENELRISVGKIKRNKASSSVILIFFCRKKNLLGIVISLRLVVEIMMYVYSVIALIN